MSDNELAPFRRGVWRGRVDERLLPHLPAEDLAAWIAQTPHEVIRDRPTARTYRMTCGQGVLYAKLLTGLKDGARGWRKWLHDWRWRFGPSRSMRVLRVMLSLKQAGLAVPPVMLVARGRWNRQVAELIITQACEGMTLSAALHDAPDDVRERRVEVAAARIAQLHRCGWVHGDLLPGNLILTPDGTDIVYLDNDRTRHWWPAIPANQRRRNLAQMLFRMRPIYPHSLCRRFLATYHQHMKMKPRLARRESACVLRKVRRRMSRQNVPLTPVKMRTSAQTDFSPLPG